MRARAAVRLAEPRRLADGAADGDPERAGRGELPRLPEVRPRYLAAGGRAGALGRLHDQDRAGSVADHALRDRTQEPALDQALAAMPHHDQVGILLGRLGDEFGEGICRMFMYGPDADVLFDAIKKPLLASPFSRGGHAIKRYGPAEDGIKEVKVEL